MKKIVLKQFGQLEIQEVPIPVPAPGQAVIRIHYAGICGSDLHVKCLWLWAMRAQAHW